MSLQPTRRTILICATSVAVIILLAALTAVTWAFLVNRPTGFSGEVEFTVHEGMTATAIADSLAAASLVRSPLAFRLHAMMTGIADDFRAGIHPLDGSMTMRDIAAALTRNPPPLPDITVTVIEGLTVWETASVLMARAAIDSAAFERAATDSTVARNMGVDKPSLEGYLYPDTYFIRHDTTPEEMIGRMVGRFNEVFGDSLRQRASQLGMTVHEAVTLASIIESETPKDVERPLVSSVFHRRLAMGRPLGANPTIQYALRERRRLLTDDLGLESPYNTYIHAGLPPGPICSPGERSLLAALYPADTPYLYFVADGAGGHIFSRTLAEHTRAVRRYRQIRRRNSSRQ